MTTALRRIAALLRFVLSVLVVVIVAHTLLSPPDTGPWWAVAVTFIAAVVLWRTSWPVLVSAGAAYVAASHFWLGDATEDAILYGTCLAFATYAVARVAAVLSGSAPDPADLDDFELPSMPGRKIVALCGYAGAGKDTAAKGLLWTGEWAHGSFAAKIKDVIYAVNPLIPVHRGQLGYDAFNVTDDPVVYVRYADFLDKVGHEQGKYGNQEVRQLQQRTGDDGGRQVIGPDVWVDAAMDHLPDSAVVFTDCRFPNEASAVQRAGGYVIRVVRPGTRPVNDHPSETALDDFPVDAVIVNDGTMADLGQKLVQAVADLAASATRPPVVASGGAA